MKKIRRFFSPVGNQIGCQPRGTPREAKHMAARWINDLQVNTAAWAEVLWKSRRLGVHLSTRHRHLHRPVNLRALVSNRHPAAENGLGILSHRTSFCTWRRQRKYSNRAVKTTLRHIFAKKLTCAAPWTRQSCSHLQTIFTHSHLSWSSWSGTLTDL